MYIFCTDILVDNSGEDSLGPLVYRPIQYSQVCIVLYTKFNYSTLIVTDPTSNSSYIVSEIYLIKDIGGMIILFDLTLFVPRISSIRYSLNENKITESYPYI